MPKLPLDFVRGHAFINSGALLKFNSSQLLKTGYELLSNIPSTSVGLGVVARFAGFRLELNYCLPVYASSTDITKRGFQLGIGINFL